MPNGLDAKVNGSGAPRKPGEAAAASSTGGGNGGAPAGRAGAELDAALSGLAVANLPFVEELYFQFLNEPASVAPAWRRTFEGLGGGDANGNGNGSGNGTILSVAALTPPAAFRRSIFSAGGVPAANASVGV